MKMIRKFKGNNAIQGRIAWQMGMFVNNGAIKFEKGEKKKHLHYYSRWIENSTKRNKLPIHKTNT